MQILSRLRLRTKLALLTGLSILGVLGSIAVAASLIRHRMVDDRIDKLASVVDTVIGVARSLDNEVTAHRLSRDQAIEQFRSAVHAIRFDGQSGYVTAWSTDGTVVAHGTAAALEGKPTPVADTGGRTVLQLGEAALNGGDQGVVAYAFPRPGQTTPQPKLAYVARFTPWQMMFMSGVYVDDIDAASHAMLLRLAVIGGGILLATLLATWLIDRDIGTSLGRLRAAMAQLSKGDLATAIPETERRDEVGDMAGAVLVFKEQMVRAERLADEREQDRESAETAKQAALLAMAETIEGEAKTVLAEVTRRTEVMTEVSDGMSASATRTRAAAQSAASSAAQALTNAQTVAGAAEQLSASIREIAGQVSQSNAVVGRAVEAGRATRDTISALNEQVGQIGSVADMISEIAARTNLLALNATIEAARAGDAGKGFAVVASEVKQLATQTARSTEEISRHIAEVRSATGASVAAVSRIEQTIEEIDAIAGSIAAAVEEQGAATAEISRSVTETATAASEMTSRTQEVSTEAEQTGSQAIEVRENSVALGSVMHDLNRTVIHLVRTATSEVDRRRYRRRPCLVEATLSLRGRSETAQLNDISERGCYAVTGLHCKPGESVSLAVPRFDIQRDCHVIEQAEGGLHIAFLGDGLTAAEADKMALTTIAELMQIAKNDHIAFVKRVIDAVSKGEKLPPDGLASPHHCRFGRWFDRVSDAPAMALPSFKAIRKPHEAVHELGRRTLIAFGADDAAAAQRYSADMRSQSEQVLRLLDQFAGEYPTTFQMAAAA